MLRWLLIRSKLHCRTFFCCSNCAISSRSCASCCWLVPSPGAVDALVVTCLVWKETSVITADPCPSTLLTRTHGFINGLLRFILVKTTQSVSTLLRPSSASSVQCSYWSRHMKKQALYHMPGWLTLAKQVQTPCKLGTKSKTRRLRSALRIVVQEYGDRNWLNRPQSASDARARGRRPTVKSAYPDPQILTQCNISSNYPHNVWFFCAMRMKHKLN